MSLLSAKRVGYISAHCLIINRAHRLIFQIHHQAGIKLETTVHTRLTDFNTLGYAAVLYSIHIVYGDLPTPLAIPKKPYSYYFIKLQHHGPKSGLEGYEPLIEVVESSRMGYYEQ
jgi:hypothetical protein